MDKEHIKGAADKAKGAVKDAAGKMMDDKRLQAEGKMDKAKGEARQVLGDDKLRTRLSKAGYKQVKKYSWKKMARQTHAVYMKVLNQS